MSKQQTLTYDRVGEEEEQVIHKRRWEKEGEEREEHGPQKQLVKRVVARVYTPSQHIILFTSKEPATQ